MFSDFADDGSYSVQVAGEENAAICLRETTPALAVLDAASLGFTHAVKLGNTLSQAFAGEGRLPIIILTPSPPTGEMMAQAAEFQIGDVLPWPAAADPLKVKIALYADLYRRRTGAALPVIPGGAPSTRGEWLLHFVNEATDYALFFTDPQGHVIDWMPGAEKIFGHKPEEVIGRDASFIFTRTDRLHDVPQKEMASARRNGRARDERWHLRADGSRFFAEGRLVALRGPDERLFGFAKIVRDFTSEKVSDERLRSTMERLNLAIETTGIGIWEFDPVARLPNWSDQARRLLSLPADEPDGIEALLMKVHEDDRTHVQRVFEQARDSAFGESVSALFRVGDPEYLRWISLKAYPVRSSGDQGFERLLGTITDVTRERAAEQSLRASLDEVRSAQQAAEQSNRMYRELFETAREGIWRVNAAGRIEMANPRMAEMLGFEVDDLIGRTPAEFGFEEEPSRLRGPPAPGVSATTDVHFRHRDGHSIWALRTHRRRVNEGRVEAAFDMFTDITERRAAVDALRSSEEQFRTFFESSAAGHAIVDPITQYFMRVNQRFGEITGYEPEELIGRTMESVVHPADRPEEAQLVASLLRGAIKEGAIEKRCIGKGGGVVWVHQTLALLRDAAGEPRRQIGVIQDITDRKVAEAELRESQAQLALAVDAAQLGTFFYDTATGREHWNRRARELIGLSADTPESRELFVRLIHPEDRARVVATLEGMLATDRERTFKVQYRVVWPDGTIKHLMATGRTTWHTQPDGRRTVRLLGTTQDISEAKRSEEELQRKVTERTRALEDKTAQLERFSYTVAHDLRSPLRAISGYADFVKEDLGENANARITGYVARIKSAAQRLDTLINDLLAYSHISQADAVLDELPLNEALDRVLERLSGEIEARHARVTIPDELPSVLAERAMLDLVLGNLLSNAIKFVEPGVTPEVSVDVEQRDDRIRVILSDNGIGIAPAYRERIFGMFERLGPARPYPGTGVGLAIVQKAMERIGGAVGVDSEPGAGSRFWIELKKSEQ